MEEIEFRSTMLCQMLGSTTRYRILKLLTRKRMTPGELCRTLGKSPAVISGQLGKLRTAGLVRFKREPGGLMYWPKVDGIRELIAYLERFARRLS